MSDEVTVVSNSYFRGQPGEGTDGMVVPGDVLTITRQRSADLKANGLVADAPAAAPDAPAEPEPPSRAKGK